MTQPIYTGTITHRRFHDKTHEFTYKTWMFYFDINDIENSLASYRSVSSEKFNWFSYYRRNYLNNINIPLDEAVRELIQQRTGHAPLGKIFLLTHLSCLGYCFNPISIYFVYNSTNDDLENVVLEVTNTPWGEKHYYVLSTPDEINNNIRKYKFKKALHVSPFMQMDYQYELNLKHTDDQIIVHMSSLRNGEKHFDATLSLTATKITNNKVFEPSKRFPLMTQKGTLAIYWQALLLWLKGVKFYSHPKNGVNTHARKD